MASNLVYDLTSRKHFTDGSLSGTNFAYYPFSKDLNDRSDHRNVGTYTSSGGVNGFLCDDGILRSYAEDVAAVGASDDGIPVFRAATNSCFQILD